MEPGRIAASHDPLARRALYVAFTRAVHRLWVLTAGRWSPLLEGYLSSESGSPSPPMPRVVYSTTKSTATTTK